MKPLSERITHGPVEFTGLYGSMMESESPFREVCDFMTSEFDKETSVANAELITETFTVTQQTGLTPAQLAARVVELEGALLKARERVKYSDPKIITMEEIDNALTPQ